MIDHLLTHPPHAHADAPRGGSIGAAWALVREFFRSPRNVGTVFPCSRAVAAAMVRDLDTTRWTNVVELGAGGGALTPTLLQSLPESCRFVAVEVSPSLARQFRKRLPEVEIATADAAALVRLCKSRDITGLDAVFSALPLRLLPPDVLSSVLAAAAKMLKPGGVFAQVTYWPAALPPGRKLRQHVASYMGALESDALVAGNAPPAWVFRCRKARIPWQLA